MAIVAKGCGGILVGDNLRGTVGAVIKVCMCLKFLGFLLLVFVKSAVFIFLEDGLYFLLGKKAQAVFT